MSASTYTKQLLSASSNGRQIGVTGTVTVHVPTTGTTQLDEIWLYAINNGAAPSTLNLYWGGTTVSDLSQFTVSPTGGRQLIVDGKLLYGSTPITAWLTGGGTVAIEGFVNRITGVTTTGSTDPRALDWALRVVRNGGSYPSFTTLQALTPFFQSLSNSGLIQKMVLMNCFVPDSLIAALTPLIPGPGNDPWTTGNFVTGDLGVNGLTGNATNKVLFTGFIPSYGGYLTSGNAGMTAYVYDNSASNSGYTFGSAGAANSSHFALFLSDVAGTKSEGFIWRFVNVGTDWVQGNKPAGGGYFSVNRISLTQIDMYFGSSVTPHFDLATGSGAQTGGVITDQQIYAFAVNPNGGGATAFSGQTISFMAVHQGLTSADSLNFYNAIQALRVALGGGFV